MRFKDFEYDGISLSSRGLGIVSFNGMEDDDITTDSQRTFNSISLNNGEYQPFINSVFEDRLEVEFSIAKDFCEDADGNGYFTIPEIEEIQYWLNRPTPHVFRILDEPEYADEDWLFARDGDDVPIQLYAYGLNENLSYYRRSSGTLSSNKFEAIRRIWYLYRKVEKLNIIYATYCFIFYAVNAVRRRI